MEGHRKKCKLYVLIPMGKMILQTSNEILFWLLVDTSMLRLLVLTTNTLSISMPVLV